MSFRNTCTDGNLVMIEISKFIKYTRIGSSGIPELRQYQLTVTVSASGNDELIRSLVSTIVERQAAHQCIVVDESIPILPSKISGTTYFSTKFIAGAFPNAVVTRDPVTDKISNEVSNLIRRVTGMAYPVSVDIKQIDNKFVFFVNEARIPDGYYRTSLSGFSVDVTIDCPQPELWASEISKLSGNIFVSENNIQFFDSKSIAVSSYDSTLSFVSASPLVRLSGPVYPHRVLQWVAENLQFPALTGCAVSMNLHGETYSETIAQKYSVSAIKSTK